MGCAELLAAGALNHFGYGGVVFNGFSSREHMGSRGWRKAGADKHPPIFARVNPSASSSATSFCEASLIVADHSTRVESSR